VVGHRRTWWLAGWHCDGNALLKKARRNGLSGGIQAGLPFIIGDSRVAHERQREFRVQFFCQKACRLRLLLRRLSEGVKQ
jgi:hypothetical protein